MMIHSLFFCFARQWVLLTGSEDDIYDMLPALLWGMAYRLPALGLLAFPVFVY
jgi:hypothetical protein